MIFINFITVGTKESIGFTFTSIDRTMNKGDVVKDSAGNFYTLVSVEDSDVAGDVRQITAWVECVK